MGRKDFFTSISLLIEVRAVVESRRVAIVEDRIVKGGDV